MDQSIHAAEDEDEDEDEGQEGCGVVNDLNDELNDDEQTAAF